MSTQDPDPYARLFRDDPIDAQPIEVQEIVDVVDDAEVVAPARDVPAMDPGTGRLFRSVGAAAVPDAIPALTSSQAGRLKSVRDREQDVMRIETIRPDVIVDEEPPPIPVEYAPRELEPSVGREGRVTGIGVYVGVIGLTSVIALGQVLIFGGQPGWMAGVALVLVSIAAALGVRRSDDVTAIIAPPLAFAVVALTVGQISGAGDTLTSRAVTAFFILGNNWMWIVGATVAALVIVALRRRRSS